MAANASTNDRAIWINDFDTDDEDAGEGKCLILFAGKSVGNFWVLFAILIKFEIILECEQKGSAWN